MDTIGAVSCGIKALEGVLNNLVVAINRRTIDTGSGLTKSENESGILICLATGKAGEGGDSAPATGSSGAWLTTPDGETAAWHQIDVMDANCNKLKMYVWGGTPGGKPA